MTENRSSVACPDCEVGAFSIYGPTHLRLPGDIESKRHAVIQHGAGRTILRESEKTDQYFTLRSGWAFRFKRLADGRRQILSFVLPGDPINLESLCFADPSLLYSVKSLTDILVCSFPLPEMVALVHDSPEQKAQLESHLRANISASYGRLADIGRRSALGRIAHLLLELEDRLKRKKLSQGGQFNFPVRQEHLGDAVGLTTVYVNRTLDRLRRLGVIEYDRDLMRILDADKLRAIGDEE